MVKVKTSIYVDKELWEKIKMYALKRDMEISGLLEDVVRYEMIEDALDDILLDSASSEDYDIDFEPVKPREGLVSELVRVMRDERANSVSG